MTNQKAKIAIVVGGKGRGSNMRALAERIAQTDDLEVVAVVAPKVDIPAVETAQSLNLPVRVVPTGEGYDDRLADALADADWVCLAGYLRLFPTSVLNTHAGRVLNIHPALLPKFGGKGMYGMHVHEAVVAAGETESGCTVHFVTERYDEGAVVAQAKCEVLPSDSAEEVAAKVLKLEHETYFAALRRLTMG
jgi:formyltetrahydrofolate-dependent phosphoribosylglycinamide formyltransferase